nr:uncharacterized mitochondrial protein AtMg00810-like [Tanacetum cinerariifolium]
MFDQDGKLVVPSNSESHVDCSNGCSKHMTGNLKLLINFVWKFMGTVRFGNNHVAAILGFEVAFRRNACFVRNLEGVDLLKGDRSTNLYTINLHEMASASPICLMAQASSTKSWLWHQRLSHLNFDTINDLVRNDLVAGLPKFKYHKEHLYPLCEQGKSKRASHPPKPVPNSRQRLHLLHMDLCGPMRIASINGKRIYNRQTKEIMETMNVSFDELSAMAFEQRSSKPGLQCMTSGQISSGLDLTYAPSTITTQQPTEGADNTKTRRPQPRSNTKNDRVPSASKSSCIKNKEVEVEEHHRNLLLSKNKKHMSSACTNVKFATQDVKVVCAMCKQCLISVNHDVCLLNYVNGKISRGKKQKANVSINEKQKKQQPKIKKTKKVGFIERLATPKPSKPRFFLRQRLHLLHMDLCGPMRIASTNGKRYVLVIVDDYSRYTWVHFLISKDEAPEVLKEYFDSVGISHQVSSVRTPQQNGVVERRNQTLVEASRTILIFSRALLFLWAEAIATACFTQNLSIIHRRFNKTPYELINGRKPDISFLHVFGALCYPKNNREDIGKLGAKGDIGFFIGYSADSCAYRVYNRRTSFLHVFGALCYPKNNREDIGKLGAKGDISFFIGYSADSCAYRVYNRRTKKIIETMNVSFDELSAVAFEQRSSKPGLQSMTSRQISSGLDLTYAPSTIITQQPTEGELDLLFEAMYDDYIGGQSSAAQRTQQGNQASLQPKTVADNVPNAMFDANMFVNPFATSSTSAAESSSSQYVDPSNMHTFYQPYPHEFQWTKDHPLEQVIGEPSQLVLTKNQLRSDGDMCMYTLTSIYVLEILNKYGMESCDPVGTPMEIKDKIDLDQNGTPVDATKYHSMIGALMYLTSSRPDIVHATCLCARYQAMPTEKHLKEVKRIFCYLRGTVNTGLWYTKDSGFELTGFSDTDYAGCKDTFKSTSGGAQFLGEKLVSWSSKKQDCTALSTAKAEYMSLSACCAQVLWMRTQLTDYGFNFKKIPIYCDSKSAIAISCNPAKDKGKGIMQETELPNKIKKREMIQLSLDEEIAQKLHAKELAKETAKQEQEKVVSKAKCDECKYDKISYDKAYKDMQQKIKRLQAQLGDLKGKSKDTSCVSDTRNPLYQKLENENVELEFQVLNYARENAHLKATYKNLFDSISVSCAQTKSIIASLQNELQSNIYKNVKLKTQLFKNVSDQKDNTQDASANTKFAKQPVVENLPKVEMFRINLDETSREAKKVPNTVRASARTKPITVSQPHVITKKYVNSDLNGLSSTGVDNTKTRKPQPRSNTKNDSVPSASKSSRSQKKEAEVEEHHRNLLLSKNNKHISSACNNIKIDSQDVISKVVCAMCKKCLISVNHDKCLSKNVNGKNSCGKNQKEKPRKSRLLLRWSQTGRLFNQEGKIVDSSESKSKSDCSNGDNACTSNTMESKIKRFPNSTSLLDRLFRFVYGTVRFGNDHVAAIFGFGDLQWGNILITRVYFVEGLGHNLFSVGQFCDSDLEVAFRRDACFVRNLEGVDLLKGDLRFGNHHVAAILGFGDLQWGNILITKFYFVKGLGHNLFSVGQFCDSDLEVAFRRNACFVRNLEGVDLLKGDRSTNLHTINLHDMDSASPICLMARASSTKSWLWHQRLSHLNFDTINDLAKNDLVSGLPKFKYHKEHFCPSCEQGKSKRASHPPKPVPNSRQRLHLLHMDLCDLMRIASINGKRYILVILDDYSHYTWVHFLRSKDEAPEVIKTFLKRI